MTDKNTKDTSFGRNVTDAVKSWLMVIVALIFILLYTAVLLGWLKPLTDITMINRLEPIIFVVIGYYFGWLPARRNENILKDEINRQTQKADAAQHAKEKAQQEREALEEKIKNVKTALNIRLHNSKTERLRASDISLNLYDRNVNLRNLVNIAINILDS